MDVHAETELKEREDELTADLRSLVLWVEDRAKRLVSTLWAHGQLHDHRDARDIARIRIWEAVEEGARLSTLVAEKRRRDRS